MFVINPPPPIFFVNIDHWGRPRQWIMGHELLKTYIPFEIPFWRRRKSGSRPWCIQARGPGVWRRRRRRASWKLRPRKKQKCQKVELVLIPYQLFLETYLALFNTTVEPNKKIHSPCQDSDPRQPFDKIELKHHSWTCPRGAINLKFVTSEAGRENSHNYRY